MASDPDLSALLDKGFRPRSTLAEWMRENHDTLFERISTQVPDWPALAAVFAQAGLTNRYGKPPQAEATRKLWRQVHKDVIADRTKKPDQSPKPVSAIVASPRHAPPPAPVRKPGPTAKEISPTKPIAPTPDVPAAEPDDDPLAAIRREMNQRSGRS
jgi:hypothetical protein